jgi:predicted enzyme related to lactoylglutathione lyase
MWGGWTVESKIKLAQTIVDKIAYLFFNKTKTNDKQHTGVSGIGGLFLKAEDPELLKSWYAEKLGFNVDQWGSTFWWTDKQGKKASTQWSIFPNDTKYFDPSKKDFMFNYRVNNLEKTLEHLKAHGILPLAETEEYNYGKFNWILDPEGNKIELWEPMDSAFL